MKIIHVFVDTVVVDQQTNAGISVNDIMALVSQRLRAMEEKHEVQIKAFEEYNNPTERDDFSFAKATGKI